MPSQNIRLSRPSVPLYVYLSVPQSHAGILSKWLDISLNFFHHWVTAILVFPCQTVWQHSDEDLLNGVVECKGYEKIAISDQYLALSRKWYKTEPWLLWKASRKLHPSFRMLPV